MSGQALALKSPHRSTLEGALRNRLLMRTTVVDVDQFPSGAQWLSANGDRLCCFEGMFYSVSTSGVGKAVTRVWLLQTSVLKEDTLVYIHSYICSTRRVNILPCFEIDELLRQRSFLRPVLPGWASI